MDILYQDSDLIVCIKPPRALSTDEPGGLPDMLREALGNPNADIRTVHRLDQVVSGLMVLARNGKAASELSRQVREDIFQKEYLAILHGIPAEKESTLKDLLGRDKARRMTYVADAPGKDVREASLSYVVLNENENMSRVQIKLHTGRTHQIRVQFSSRGNPLVGERKYCTMNDPCEIALWSYKLGFYHPSTGEWKTFSREPENKYPWDTV